MNGSKQIGVAYALWALLGALGAHRFYLGRSRSASVMLVLGVVMIGALVMFNIAGGAVTLLANPAYWGQLSVSREPVFIPAIAFAATAIILAILWISDAIRMPAMVRGS